MKNKFKNNIKLLLTFPLVAIAIISCDYQEVANASYPDQAIYMPAAKSGIYIIDNVSVNNAPFRYVVEKDSNKIIIPLGVYRSGVNNNGNVKISINVNNDTVNKLISNSILLDNDNSNPILLPEDKYTIPSSIQLQSGIENGNVQLSIDVPFLLANPNKRFALGITISSENIKVNPLLSTTIVVINTNFLFPKANFTYAVDQQDSTKVIFTNTSMYGLKYTWDFGDGSPVFNDMNPPLHKYNSLGIYNLKLTVQGILGNTVTLDSIVHLWKNITTTYFPNPGNPFLRSDNRASKTGNLKDWDCTLNVKSSNGYGGYYADAIPVMDFFSSIPLLNAKIYRTIDLPKGIYKTGFVNAGFKGSNDCYFVAALGNEIPNIESILGNSQVLDSFHWNTDILTTKHEIYFELKTPQRVTIGFVVTNTAKSEVKINSVFLFQ